MRTKTILFALLALSWLAANADGESVSASSAPFAFSPAGAAVVAADATPFGYVPVGAAVVAADTVSFGYVPAGMSVVEASSEPFVYGIPKVELLTNGLTIADTSYVIYTNGVALLPNDQGRYIVFTNTPVTVRYLLEKEGCYFANGTKTSVGGPIAADQPVVDLGATICKTTEKVGSPMIQLGVVAQRYPWNGIVDVNYRVCFWPADQSLVASYHAFFTVEMEDVAVTNDLAIAGSGTVIGVTNIDMSALAPETQGNARIKAFLKHVE